MEHMVNCEQRQPPGRIIYLQDIHEKVALAAVSEDGISEENMSKGSSGVSNNPAKNSKNVNKNSNNTTNKIKFTTKVTRIAVYEIDAMQHKQYCQHLCLLSKLFLDHKTLYFDVDPFLFYVLCELDNEGATVVGYFSKEKDSIDKNNLACIIVLPPFQRKGYGKFIIDLSYKISQIEKNKDAGPERPLSDLGNVSYRSYWDYTILTTIHNAKYGIQIEKIAELTGICRADVIDSLKRMNLTKFWKGEYTLDDRIDKNILENMLASYVKPKLLVRLENLKWSPGKFVS